MLLTGSYVTIKGKKKTGSFVKFSSFYDLKLYMKNKSIDRIVNNI